MSLCHIPRVSKDREQDSLRLIVDSRDQPVFVAADIEDRPSPDQISAGIHLFHFGRRFPRCPTHHPIPGFEVSLRVRMLSPELLQGASFYDAHGRMGSHNENRQSSLVVI
jgi:hypothetical protein